MAIRVRKTYDGRWETLQAFSVPAIYLDHWAVRRFSDNPKLGNRFSAALLRARGSWCVSHQTLAEFAGPGDVAHAEAAEVLIDSTMSNIYFVELDVKKAIVAEQNNGGSRNLHPPPDHELLSLVTDRLPVTKGVLTFKGLLVAIAQSKDKVGATFKETNDEIANMVATQRADPEYVKKAKYFRPESNRSPTLTLMGEMLRSFVIDENTPFTRNDASDFQHAVISTTYCQYVLLDKKWQHVLAVATRRIEEQGLPFTPAKCFSESRDGIDQFLTELESLDLT